MNDPRIDPENKPIDAARALFARAREGLYGRMPVAEARAACAMAVSLLEKAGGGSPELPAALVLLGQLHEGEGSATYLAEAVKQYDRAIEWWTQRNEAVTADPRGLAVTWMNRGNALQKQEEPSAWNEGERSYEEAIKLLEGKPLDINLRLTAGAAWMNLGVVRQKQNVPAKLNDAVAAYHQAAELFRGLPLDQEAHFRRSLSAAYINEGSARLGFDRREEEEQAIGLALEALKLIGEDEGRDPVSADAALRARRLLCDAIGRQVVKAKEPQTRVPLAAQGSDVAEEALRCVHFWASKTPNQFGFFGLWFFHFGAFMYSDFQPQFLSEYLDEWLEKAGLTQVLADGVSLRKIAVDAASRARSRVSEALYARLNTPDAGPLGDLLRGLQETETRAQAALKSLEGREAARANES